jgi:hypothetical protein
MTQGAAAAAALTASMPRNPRTANADPEAQRQAEIRQAARQFEGILATQMFQVMRGSLSGGSLLSGEGPGNHMYSQMIDQAMSSSLTEGNGMGLQRHLVQAMGGDPQALEQPSITGSSRTPYVPIPGAQVTRTPVTGALLGGDTRDLQGAASGMLTRGNPADWGRAGTLDANDLASDLSTEVPGGVARFNVRDARGYEGYYKCNLFAMELARRGGFQVPVVGRARGWGYPSPNGVTDDAGDGRLHGDWAQIATGMSAQAVDGAITSGSGAFMLTGHGSGDRAGHMGIVERIHEIDYAEDGTVRRVVYDGWEARRDGAQHLTRRTWNINGNSGGNLARNGFTRIEILQLVPSTPGQRPEIPTTGSPGASQRDINASSSAQNRTIFNSEENQ